MICANDCNEQTDRKMDKAMATGEIADLHKSCSKIT